MEKRNLCITSHSACSSINIRFCRIYVWMRPGPVHITRIKAWSGHMVGGYTYTLQYTCSSFFSVIRMGFVCVNILRAEKLTYSQTHNKYIRFHTRLVNKWKTSKKKTMGALHTHTFVAVLIYLICICIVKSK